MKTLKQVVDRVLERLGDEDSDVWGRSEIEGYVKDGYDRFCRDSLCLWDVTYVESVPYTGSHTAEFEEGYATVAHGVFNFTGGDWEREYCDNAVGPANHTATWEWEYLDRDFMASVLQLPDTLLVVDRVTNDFYRIEPLLSLDLRENDARYRTDEGTVLGYVMDGDGANTIRKVKIPAGRADVYETTGQYGTLRYADDDEFGDSPDVVGSYGVLRSAPEHFPIGQQGAARRVYRDGGNVRVEYFRRGRDLATTPFELPDRYVKYIELWAMSEARDRQGAGQNKQLAAHFRQRFGAGVERAKSRIQSVTRERIARMGGGAPANRWPALAQPPYHYSRIPR